MKKLLLLVLLTGIAGVSVCQPKKQGSENLNIPQQVAELTHYRDSLRTLCDNSFRETEDWADRAAQAAGELKIAQKTGSGASQAKIDSLQSRVTILAGKRQASQRRLDRNLEELDNLIGRLNKANEQLTKEQGQH